MQRSQSELDTAYQLLGFTTLNGHYSHVSLAAIDKQFRDLARPFHPDQHSIDLAASGKYQALNTARDMLKDDDTICFNNKIINYLHNKFNPIQYAEIEPYLHNISEKLRGNLKALCKEKELSGLLIAEDRKHAQLKPYLPQVAFWQTTLGTSAKLTLKQIKKGLFKFNEEKFRNALELHLKSKVLASEFTKIQTYLKKQNVIANLLKLARYDSPLCSIDDSNSFIFNFDQLTPWLLDEKFWDLLNDTGFAAANISPIKLEKIITALKYSSANGNSKHILYFHLAQSTLHEISPFERKKGEWLELKQQLITQAIDRYFELSDKPYNSKARWEKTFGENGDIAHIEQFFSESTFTVPVSKYLKRLSLICINKLEKNAKAETLLNDIFARITATIKDRVEKLIAAEPDYFVSIKSRNVIVQDLIDDLHEQVIDALEVQNQQDATIITDINLESDTELMALINKERARIKAAERNAQRIVKIEPPAPEPEPLLAILAPEPELIPEPAPAPVIIAAPAAPIIRPRAPASIDEPKEIKFDDAAPKPESTNFFARNARKLGITTSISSTVGLVIGAGIAVLLALAPFTAGLTLPIAIGIGAAIFGIGTILGFVAGSIACAAREAKAAVAAPAVIAPAPVAPAPKASGAKASPEKPKPTTEPVSAPPRKTSGPKAIGSSSSARSFGGRSAKPSKIGSFGGRTSVAGSFGGRSFKDGEQPVLPSVSPALSSSGPR